MGVISMLEPLAALELHVPVVAVLGDVARARDVQGVVEVAVAAADVEVEVDVEVDSMILSIFGDYSTISFSHNLWRPPVHRAVPPRGLLITTGTGSVLGLIAIAND